MADPLSIIPLSNIKPLIYTIRGQQVMLDSDLAEIYEVETKFFNRAVKRNIERFPDTFRFQLTQEEYDSLRSQWVTPIPDDSLRCQIGTLEKEGRGQHRKYLPYAFTEQGVSMLSAVLRSDTAIKVSIQIINAFVEKRQLALETKTAENFEKVFQALEASAPPKQGIFYDGQVHDAHVFASDLIRSAKKTLILIDNYVDDTVLTLLTKRKQGVAATIFTKSISKQLDLDLEKHNAQYPPIEIKTFKDAHDRFLILDERDIYHIGASLKDLGKKWFAFSKFETGALDMLKKLGDGK